MSKLIIAEKPSVAKSIASALGASSRADGFYEGNGLLVKEAPQPVMIKKIGKTTYRVKIHFSETSKETMSDKIKRLILNDCERIS